MGRDTGGYEEFSMSVNIKERKHRAIGAFIKLSPSASMKSRPCTPCKARGEIVAAHRIMADGSGRCAECYAQESGR